MFNEFSTNIDERECFAVHFFFSLFVLSILHPFSRRFQLIIIQFTVKDFCVEFFMKPAPRYSIRHQHRDMMF